TGGAGGAGIVRVDAASAVPAGASTGPAFEVAGAELLVDAATYVVRGRAAPDATVRVEAIDRPGVSGSSTAAADGTFEVSITLETGLNRLRLVQATAAGDDRAWNGTSFEVARSAGGAMPLPVGGVLDVAYVPAG
ncbi:MAG: hypothetical protein M3Y87_04630, partial [Myxococcota bacterium]|nr:hypothetical protein [Myxococcota bacterium]